LIYVAFLSRTLEVYDGAIFIASKCSVYAILVRFVECKQCSVFVTLISIILLDHSSQVAVFVIGTFLLLKLFLAIILSFFQDTFQGTTDVPFPRSKHKSDKSPLHLSVGT